MDRRLPERYCDIDDGADFLCFGCQDGSRILTLEANIGEEIRLEPRGVPGSSSDVSTMLVMLVGYNNIP